SPESLLLGELAEYVIRRVIADSAGQQTPWLLRGKRGWVDSKDWNAATREPLVALGRNGRPLGWPDLPEPPSDPGVDAASAAAGPVGGAAPNATRASGGTAGGGDPSAEPAHAADGAWAATAAVWSELDAWRAASPRLSGWSPAAAAPL